MYDHTLFLRTLSEFSAKLLTSYDIDAVLQDLMQLLRDVLGTYTHLIPASGERTRLAVDRAFACYIGATSGAESAASQA